MISHTECDHPSTSSARAKCRRARSKGEEGGTQTSPSSPRASRKTEWGGKTHHDPSRERNRGTTPRDRDKQCVICGVERIVASGTDPLTGILIFVGERCSYMVERQDDFKVVEN